MAWDDEEEKSYGQFTSKNTSSPRNDKGALYGYYVITALLISISAACIYFGYDLIKNGKGMESATTFKAGIISFDGAAGTALIVVGLGIAIYIILNLKVKLT